MLTPAELAYFKRVVPDAPSGSNPRQMVQGGLEMWGGKPGYCAILTAWLETDLPEVAQRHSPETAKRLKDGWTPGAPR